MRSVDDYSRNTLFSRLSPRAHLCKRTGERSFGHKLSSNLLFYYTRGRMQATAARTLYSATPHNQNKFTVITSIWIESFLLNVKVLEPVWLLQAGSLWNLKLPSSSAARRLTALSYIDDKKVGWNKFRHPHALTHTTPCMHFSQVSFCFQYRRRRHRSLFSRSTSPAPPDAQNLCARSHKHPYMSCVLCMQTHTRR